MPSLTSASRILPGSPGAPEPMTAVSAWLAAIRPRTLGLSVSPVLVGTALAVADGNGFRALPFLLALGAAMLIQIGTNLHNDVADFRKGIDGTDRLGPPRATAQGWLRAEAVERAAWMVFALVFLLGIGLSVIGGWPIVLLGLCSLSAAVAYSGGPWPLSSRPVGELFVFLFFGLAAVGGSYYLQAGYFTGSALLAGALMGLPAAAVLVVNNYRDRFSDERAGRRTLAVLLPEWASRWEYALFLSVPFLLLPSLFEEGWFVLLPELLVIPASMLIVRLFRVRNGVALNELLARTASFQLVLGLLLSVALLGQGLYDASY